MSNAKDFSLDAELEATRAWETDDAAIELDDVDLDEPDDGFESVYADDADPEDDLTSGEQDLAERHALRRVAGLRTELEDIPEVDYRQLRLERVALVGVWT